ncbi:hypothetical protein V6N12_051725 [Hibiscus sabdariffa]|uniref:Uncharacterized protein n=1 Tax=Hibiscus sabdariffa TaxID=183260 RepID=A0ABR2GG64_9ROSI
MKPYASKDGHLSDGQKLQYHVDLATCRWPGRWDPPTQLRAESRGVAVEDLATCRARGLAGPEGQGAGSNPDAQLDLVPCRWRGPSGPARPRALQVARSSAAAPLSSARS